MLATFHEGYYSTAATVIPLFMFLIVFERRLLTVDLTRGRWFSLMEVVASAAAVSVGTAANHGEFRSVLQAMWS